MFQKYYLNKSRTKGPKGSLDTYFENVLSQYMLVPSQNKSTVVKTIFQCKKNCLLCL